MDAENLDIEKTLQYLTLDEKLRLLTGEGPWHTFGAGELPRVRMADGPNGVRMASGIDNSPAPATCFPTPSMLANSWDDALLYNVGVAVGEEATALGVNVLLAPALNVKRNPLGGRNYDYFSEDPYLTGTLGRAYVAGVQSTGVGACVKHFAAGGQQTRRDYSNCIVDERALREIYIKPFEIAMDAQPAAIMTAHNKLNGEQCSQNEYLLKTLLRNELHFHGLTVSDWGTVRDRAKALKAGLDLEMPGSRLSFDTLKAAYAAGEIDDATIDRSVRRVIGLVDNYYLEPYGELDADEHDKLSYNAAASSLVMLKNAELLPLTKDMRVTVVGEYAKTAPIEGEGSSHVSPLKSLSATDAFRTRAIDVAYYQGYRMDGVDDPNLIDEALLGAKGADAVIVYAGLPAPSEHVDRPDLALPQNQNRLIAALVSSGAKVAVVLTVPGPVEMPWIRGVRAVIYSGLNGQNGALAAVDALYGRINPRGKLAETFPIDTSELGTDFGDDRTLYRESIFIGYRYYNSIKRRVLFPFGHGLSFSQITYDGVKLHRTPNDDFTVSVTLSNHSPRDAYEIVQLYVADKTGRVMTPEKQLAAYAKVFIEGETATTVNLTINKRAFAFFNVKTGNWAIPNGEHKIIIAASATDIKSELSVTLDGTYGDYADYPEAYGIPVRSGITDTDFETVCGKELPVPPPRTQKGAFTLMNCLDDMSDNFFIRLFAAAARKKAKEYGAVGSSAYEARVAFIMNTPLYAVARLSDGYVSLERARGLVEIANGNFWKGLRLFLSRSSEA